MRERVAVQLGSRAFDILIALVSRPAEPVSKRDLLAQVWPDAIVDEGSLRFHVAGLRKALGDGKEGARYITTLAGRGYCFVARVTRTMHFAEPALDAAAQSNLPGRLLRMVGREDGVLMLASQLKAARFVTIVGAGGVGKTTIAVAVGHDLAATFAGAVLFIDLGALSDPKLVATHFASMLGLSAHSDDPSLTLTAHLRTRRVLLILDNCEHLIEPVASLAGRVFAAAPHVHILATSREPLRVEGEHVYRLAPLAFPRDEAGRAAATAMEFPAVQLFVERAAASGGRLDLTDQNLAIVVDICRRLDGIALAIELTAGRVAAFGLQQTAALLEERLSLLWQGQRTAPPRQQTLKATLDWSYGLLSELERKVLRKLSVFVGDFTLEAARAVLTGVAAEEDVIVGAIDSLVLKSIVATRPAAAVMRYQILESTRAYAREVSASEELADAGARHAAYYRQWLEQRGVDWLSLSTEMERAPHLAALNNVRTALEWCFGSKGDSETGVRLAAAAVPVFWEMSLMAECHRWSERALAALDEATSLARAEMHLQAGLGTALMNMHGESSAAHAALSRSLAIAEHLGDVPGQMGLLGMLHMFHVRGGNFNDARHYAQQSAAIAGNSPDPAALAFANCMLGRVLFLMGDLGAGRAALEASLGYWSRPQPTSKIFLAADRHYRAGIALARTLWLQGYPAQAVKRARRTIQAVEGHPIALTGTLAWAIGVFFWTGDLRSAEAYITRFLSDAESHLLGPNVAVGQGLKGQLAIRNGEAEAGIETLQSCLGTLQASRYGLLTTEFNISLAQGLAATGRLVEAQLLIDNTIRLVEANGDIIYMPELLRVMGGLLLATPTSGAEAAEEWLLRSLDLSRRHGARAWELRTSVDLAALRLAQGRADSGRSLLLPVFKQFDEGADTTDLKNAGLLLARLSA
ncbi:winged helix-turn-helix domain-containing protein [soil metagenome]